MYVYIQSQPGLWTVGFYSPDGEWNPESDHTSSEKAAELNGGKVKTKKALSEFTDEEINNEDCERRYVFVRMP